MEVMERGMREREKKYGKRELRMENKNILIEGFIGLFTNDFFVLYVLPTTPKRSCIYYFP